MRVNLNKDKCKAIEGAFMVLQNDCKNLDAVKVIKKTLEESFDGYTFNVSITDSSLSKNSDTYIMSIYPENSTIDKIISAVLSNKETDAIKKIWETNKVWTIEIDDQVINKTQDKFSEQELTAMLIHEIGHVVYSNSLTNKLSTIFRYEITKTSMNNQMLIKNDKIFRSIMSLPILDVCISDSKKDLKSIKEEIKADSFVKKVGYQKELESVLTKMIKMTKNNTLNDKLVKGTKFSNDILSAFQQRKDNIAKHSLLSLREGCNSKYITNFIDNLVESVFEDSKTSNSLINGRKLEYMHERADKAVNNQLVLEFFNLGGKQLKKIDTNEIDYIAVKIEMIKSESDKLMVISYTNSKIDLVDYYISICKDPKLSKKYYVPYTLNELYDIKKRLLQLKEEAFKFRIPERNKHILVSWPSGYEG